MMTLDNISTTLEGGILIATISRPKSLNALNAQTMDSLHSLARAVYDRDDIKALIITGEGEKAFVAGADITEFTALNELGAREVAEKGQDTFALFENCPKPVVAAVNGYALGGGCELAMACHLRVAVKSAQFGQPEVSLGILPGYGGTQRLPRLVGSGKALELMMTGDMIAAEEAKALGLVNHVTDSRREMMALSKKIILKILSKAPLAVSMVIDTVNAAARHEEGYRMEADAFARCTATGDFAEGAAAFLEKRKPSFTGQ